jgi:arylsulfatase A-like enzyme
MPAQPHKIMNIDHPVLGLMGYLRNHFYRRYDREYCVGRTISAAVDWLETNYDHESFFLSIDMWQPHEPFDCPWYDLSHYVESDYDGEKIMFPKYGRPSFMSEAEQQYTRATYAGSCTQVDRWIGNLLDTVEKLKLFRNTLIIWTTDHGHLFGEHDLWGKPGSELGTLFETTTRIPLIVYHPDGIGAGRRFDGIVQPPDILPSLLEFMNIPISDEIEGKSFWPLLRGETASLHEAAFSSRFPPTGAADDPSYSPEDATYFDGWVGSNQMVEPSTVTNDHWAYLCSTIAGQSKLYDLQQDPEQRVNVIDEHPDIAERMHRQWVDFLERHNAPPERVRPFLEPREQPQTRGDSPLFAFRDDLGQWIAFPNRLDAEQHAFHPEYPRPDRKIETITFDRLGNDNPRNLVFLYRQYYWAQDLV